MKRYYFFSILCLCCLVVSGQTQMIRMGAKQTSNFDEDWLFARFGFQANGTHVTEPKGLQYPSYRDGTWEKLNLPHDWGIKGPFRIELKGETGKLPWKGIGWYRKHFKVSAKDQGKQLFIDFDGAMANAEIWVNGKYIGTWPYGYSSFRMDITPAIKFGAQNLIAVRLNTEEWDSRWYPGAGIYRHVWLVKTAPIHVAHWGTFITTPEVSAEKASIAMAIDIDNQSSKNVKALVRTSIHELNADEKLGPKLAVTDEKIISLSGGTSQKVSTNALLKNPKLWSIEMPHRYIAKTEIRIKNQIIDTYFTSFGIRTISFSAKTGFILNGKKVVIKGTCNHHDLGALGAAINTSALKRQLTLLKEMGCNSIRTAHNPPAPELLELADQMGFLIWDEAFDVWKKPKRQNDYNRLFEKWHEEDLKAMVHRDRNHPSVFIWSIGNEVMEQRDVQLTKQLADIVRGEDPTRPVSNGYNGPDGARAAGAPIALDIMGVNYFFKRQAEWDADPRYANLPTIGSETASTVSSRGEYFFGKPYQNWQISSYDKSFPGWGCSPDSQFATMVKYPHLLGEYVWTGFDYLGEPTPFNSDETNLLNFRNDPEKKAELAKALEEITKKNPPSRSSYFGILDLAGFKKDRFYLYQSHWRPDLPMAHILPHWNWPNRLDSITPVHVYTSGTEAELFLNGKSLGKKSKEKGKDFRLIWNDVVYQPGELKVITYKNGEVWATDVVKTTGKAAKIELETHVKTIDNSGSDLCYITAKITDINGLVVPKATQSILFSVQGPGEIVATDNGDATSFESFQSHKKSAYNGLALAIIKAKKGAMGMITVKASSTGLIDAAVQVSIKK